MLSFRQTNILEKFERQRAEATLKTPRAARASVSGTEGDQFSQLTGRPNRELKKTAPGKC